MGKKRRAQIKKNDTNLNTTGDEFREKIRDERNRARTKRNITRYFHNIKKMKKRLVKQQHIIERRTLRRYCDYCDCKAFGYWKVWIYEGKIGAMSEYEKI